MPALARASEMLQGVTDGAPTPLREVLDAGPQGKRTAQAARAHAFHAALERCGAWVEPPAELSALPAGTVVNGDFEGQSSDEATNAAFARELAEGWLRGMLLGLLEKAKAICSEAEARFDDALMWKGNPCEPWLREVKRKAVVAPAPEAKKV